MLPSLHSGHGWRVNKEISKKKNRRPSPTSRLLLNVRSQGWGEPVCLLQFAGGDTEARGQETPGQDRRPLARKRTRAGRRGPSPNAPRARGSRGGRRTGSRRERGPGRKGVQARPGNSARRTRAHVSRSLSPCSPSPSRDPLKAPANRTGRSPRVPAPPYPLPRLSPSPALSQKDGGANPAQWIARHARSLRTCKGRHAECCAIDRSHSLLPFSPSYLLARSFASSDCIFYATTLTPRGCCLSNKCQTLESTTDNRTASGLARRWLHHFRNLTRKCACALQRVSGRRVGCEPITKQPRPGLSQSAFGLEGLTLL